MPALPHLHSAAWVVPVSAAPIAGGAVAVSAGIIQDAGPLEVLQNRYPGAALTEHGNKALTPALINAHTHLELSHLGELAAEPHDGSFTAWVGRLIELRARLGAAGEAVQEAAAATCQQQYADGVSVLADIGNTDAALALTSIFPGRLLAFHEYLGMTERSLAKNRERLMLEPDARLCSGHAPYSSHPALLSALKRRAKRLGQIFPIHTAETLAELEMLRHARGEMVDFIHERTGENITFQAAIAPEEGSIHYLYRHGLLDAQTLCVHAIHVSDEEMAIMTGTGAKVCLCPGSNRFLGVGRAPAERYLAHGILPALGTDSLASNPELSLWREMELLASEEDAPDASAIFAMATLGGAQALHVDAELGSLEAGKEADILAVPLNEPPATPEALMQALVNRYSTHPAHALSRIAP